MNTAIRTLHQAIQLALCLCLVSDWRSMGEAGILDNMLFTSLCGGVTEGQQGLWQRSIDLYHV